MLAAWWHTCSILHTSAATGGICPSCVVPQRAEDGVISSCLAVETALAVPSQLEGFS